ncbi:MAG: nuclear transport factor 2 family protein [Pseudomonadota bacterium]
MSDHASVLAANAAFYAAMRAGDLGMMDSLWSRQRQVACAHPSGQMLQGRQAVMDSWTMILGHGGAVPVVHCAAQAVVTGSTALVLCEEWVGLDQLMTANAFAFEEGAWRMISHQAAPMPGTVR